MKAGPAQLASPLTQPLDMETNPRLKALAEARKVNGEKLEHNRTALQAVNTELRGLFEESRGSVVFEELLEKRRALDAEHAEIKRAWAVEMEKIAQVHRPRHLAEYLAAAKPYVRKLQEALEGQTAMQAVVDRAVAQIGSGSHLPSVHRAPLRHTPAPREVALTCAAQRGCRGFSPRRTPPKCTGGIA
jgi:translation elongation factor EF-G